MPGVRVVLDDGEARRGPAWTCCTAGGPGRSRWRCRARAAGRRRGRWRWPRASSRCGPPRAARRPARPRRWRSASSPAVRALAQQDVLPAAVLGVRQGVVHRHAAVLARVEDRAVGEVVADEDVVVAVTVEVGDGRRVGVPLWAVVRAVGGLVVARHRLGRHERVGDSVPWSAFCRYDDRRAAPHVDQQVHPAVLVEVGGHAAHRRHHVVDRQRVRASARTARTGPPPAPGVGVTITWSVRGSTRHRSLGRPSPSRSFIATAAPTEEIQASMCLYAWLTCRIDCCLSEAGRARLSAGERVPARHVGPACRPSSAAGRPRSTSRRRPRAR